MKKFEITKREILASISIIAILLLIGVLISAKISEFQLDQNEIYDKAVKIESTDLFQYGMNTNIGNAFVYGDLEAVDPVTFPEISGEYMSIKKVKEEYTKHTRVVTKRDSKGKTRRKAETYWSWDEVDRVKRKCKKVCFCSEEFPIEKFDVPSYKYIDTIYKSSHVRYEYYGVPTKFTGTIFTELRDGTISDKTKFYDSMSIESTVKYLETGGLNIIFWIVWIAFIGGCVYGFYYLDNKWLE